MHWKRQLLLLKGEEEKSESKNYGSERRKFRSYLTEAFQNPLEAHSLWRWLRPN